MVTKRGHWRWKRLFSSHPESCPTSSCNDGLSTLVPAAANSSLTGSRCPRRFIIPAVGHCEEPPPPTWRWRRGLAQVALRGLSTSYQTLQYNLKADVPNSEGRKLFFDTHAVVQLFEENGFTPSQAEAMVKVLVWMTDSNMNIIYSDMVTKVQQEIMLQRVMSQIAAVKKDMIILEKSEFSTLLAENEKLKVQLLLLKIQLADVMNKVRSDNILDMNSEKSLVNELKAQHEKKFLEMRTEIMEMTAEQDRHLTQTNMKIDTEVAGLKTILESHKLDTIKYLAGSVFTCLTVILGFYRIWINATLNRTVQCSQAPEKLEESYEIKKTCDFISQHRFEKVALQFPDELLVDSVAVAVEIEKNSGAKPFILGDTSYGSCCVDEVAAEHVRADCIVHYGSACLSPSKRLPLMYVFEKRPVDVEKCAVAFRELYPDTQSHTIILYDVNYAHAINDLMTVLTPEYPNLVISELVVEGEQCYSHGRITKQHNETSLSEQENHSVICQFGRQIFIKSGSSITDYRVFYVGQEGATLRNFMMTWNRCSFCSFNPLTLKGRTESVSINRALMKRYYAIERAKDASVVGILVGTLGVADYLTVIQQLKETICRAGKKSYTFAMGKLNVPKLANFLEIDVFVLIACPENSLLDSSEFYKPVVTPFEMEVACNKNREWSEEYVIDFRHLLPGGQSHVPLANQQQEEADETDVSLITGALRTQKLWNSDSAEPSNGSSVVLRNQMMTVANTNVAASFLAERSWRGLEQKLGETPVLKAVEGRRGIAIAYEEEGMAS
ncbi:hypothetical protein Q5P01_003249 [Channa striata]|uniref:2-(3-amino-3-carboxypropyl)histidine synthase subunit 2 n=1 Tax=Channa striata TaxID=64152 RepID=A0AA88T163_CHASR|nr:hypothetical protein Q5P01_003249 [Channa striata]